MVIIKPIFRIFDYAKAVEFYVEWLGFTIDWEHTFGENSPIYMQVSLGDLVIHLSEHSGDCSPGARILIENFPDIKTFHTRLIEKSYKYNKPGIEVPFYDAGLLSMEVIDPFGNRITFTGKSS
jgi:catechol 2,3-dioxygenase-like lactoylglutathione lyase family enzyme